MNILIKNVTFRITLCLLLIMAFGSCSIATRFPETKYGEIDQSDTKDYYINLKDGTRYAARRIDINDSTLTIYEADRPARARYTEIAENDLPYAIGLSDIDSVKVKHRLIFLTCLVGVVAIVMIGGIIFHETWELEMGDK